jgi:hypothetical protein
MLLIGFLNCCWLVGWFADWKRFNPSPPHSAATFRATVLWLLVPRRREARHIFVVQFPVKITSLLKMGFWQSDATGRSSGWGHLPSCSWKSVNENISLWDFEAFRESEQLFISGYYCRRRNFVETSIRLCASNSEKISEQLQGQLYRYVLQCWECRM